MKRKSKQSGYARVLSFTALPRARFYALLLLLTSGFIRPVHAQDLSVLYGSNFTNDAPRTYNFEFEYRDDFNEHFGYSLSYINGGHFPKNHPDGADFKLWAGTSIFSPKFIVSAGAGPFFYADTNEVMARDIHGVAADFAMNMAWHSDNGLIYQVQAGRMLALTNFNTFTVQAGLGYDFGHKSWLGGRSGSDEAIDRQSISITAGQSVVNIRTNGRSFGESIEYRRELEPYLDVTVSALREGKSAVEDRTGGTTELWLKKEIIPKRVTLSIGGGVFAGVDKSFSEQDQREAGRFVVPMVSLAGTYSLSDHWAIRATWHRIITNDNRDADLWQGGFQYSWGGH